MIVILMLLLLVIFQLVYSSNLIPPCINESDVVYQQGQIAVGKTFLKCYTNIANPSQLPTFINGTYYGVQHVNVSVGMNNLKEIDAVEETVTLDLYLRLYWYDDRIAMPALWDQLGNDSKENGIDFTNLWFNTEEFQLWLPDIQFNDAIAQELLIQKITVFEDNSVAWSRHLVVTYYQEQFNFFDYPTDSQEIKIRMGSYSYSSDRLMLGFGPQSPLFFTYSYDGTESFKNNAIWNYESSSTETYLTTYSSDSFVLLSITMGRQSQGIVIRLVLPIMLLLLLAGLTFWASYENRVDSTTTLLLAVSALYIVILENIPLVGYLTHVDKFIFWMFLLLVIVVAVHQTYHTLRDKIEIWPLRIFYMRAIEVVGRCFVFPAVIAYYLIQINDDPVTAQVMISMVATIGLAVFTRELFELYKTAKYSFESLLDKYNNPSTKINHCSTIEKIILNYFLFNNFNTDIMPIAEYIHKHKMLDSPSRKPLNVHNIYTFYQSTGKNNKNKKNKKNHFHHRNSEIIYGDTDKTVATSVIKNNDRITTNTILPILSKSYIDAVNQNPLLRDLAPNEDSKDNGEHSDGDNSNDEFGIEMKTVTRQRKASADIINKKEVTIDSDDEH